MILTLWTAQPPMSLLKDKASLNIPCIDVTPAVLQKVHLESAQNNHDMSVTPDVSHVEMWPYAASAAALSESQRATAVLMLSLSSALPATAGTKLATHRSAAGPIVVL